MKPKAKRERVSLYLDADQLAALRAITERAGVPWSHIVRESVSDAVKRYKRFLPRG